MSAQSGSESEFGVPFPGAIVAPERWTQAAIKRLPLAGPMNWRELFGREAPVVLDLGCGNGRSTITSALARPGRDHLGIDVLPLVIRYATRRANQRGLTNVRFAVGDARELLQRLVAPGTIAEIHLYHPQPYYDVTQIHRRLVTPEFLALVHRSLLPDGTFVIQTDNPGYWQYVREVAPFFFELTEQAGPWPLTPLGMTRREIIAIQQGLQVFRGTAQPRRELDVAQARTLAEKLPLPTFDADRRLREVDRLEAE